MPLAISALLSLVLTGTFIKLGQRFSWGKAIRPEGPQSHLGKVGTITMGGAAFLVAAAVSWLLFGAGDRTGSAVLLLVIATALLGLADDLVALYRSRAAAAGKPETTGLLARWRILFQAAIALAFALDAVANGHVLTGSSAVDVILYTIAIVGSINALNLSDGLDGLAAGMMVIMLLAFSTQNLALILIGVLLGFLWYNGKPARVFMGGVGAEALGAGLAGLAITSGVFWYLPLIALVPVLVVLSVILQVSYFRLTGGKRLLKMTPLHHHFELSGWTETQIVTRFSLLTAVATGLAVWLFGGPR
jgi:phospho-N-acetylmuramoyl-pentapeptide-transferase